MESSWQDETVDIDGKTMHYVRTGTGEKPALVLVHGFSDDGLCWAPTARDLQAGYDILMPDARGHGRSGKVRTGEIVDQAAELAALLQALELGPAVVAGHSMGAWMTSELAARFPALTRAIILEDAPWGLPRPNADRPRPLSKESPHAERMRSRAGMSVDEVVAEERPNHPTWPEETLRLWCAAKTRFDLSFFEAESFERMDWQEVAKAISCPTLLITADPDKGGIVTSEVAAKAQELNPRIEVVHIPDVGHHVRFEAYEAYMDAFRAFLAKVA